VAISLKPGRQLSSLLSLTGKIIDVSQFSQERMTYIPEESKVLYRSKDGKNEKTFDAIEWLAAMPARRSLAKMGAPRFPTRENKWFVTMVTTATSVGVNGRKQMRTDGCLPSCSPMNHPRGTARTGQGLPVWGGLIQKIYEIDPLTCPKCHGPMAVIAFIEAEDVIERPQSPIFRPSETEFLSLGVESQRSVTGPSCRTEPFPEPVPTHRPCRA
jgi:hypothetical protein